MVASAYRRSVRTMAQRQVLIRVGDAEVAELGAGQAVLVSACECLAQQLTMTRGGEPVCAKCGGKGYSLQRRECLIPATVGP